MGTIYLDHNATTFPYDDVIKYVSDVMHYAYNPSSVHKLGRKGRGILENSRDVLRNVLDIHDHNIVFTSSGTEANNLALRGMPGRAHVVSQIEHSSVLNSAINPIFIPVNNSGIVDMEYLKYILMNNQNALVSIMAANNEAGVIQDINKICSICHQYNALFHTDYAQGFGKVRMDVSDVDLLTISGHKFGGVLGAAALFFRQDIDLNAIILGGGQETYIRSGTENVGAIGGMAIAAKLAMQDLMVMEEEISILRDDMEDMILAAAKEARIFGQDVARLPNTSCIYMPNVPNNVQLIEFDLNNIAISAGSACSAGRIDKSHVLNAFGVPDSQASCAIRVSLGRNTTKDDIMCFVDVWKRIYYRNNNI